MNKKITFFVALVFVVLLVGIINMVNDFDGSNSKVEEVQKNLVGVILPGAITEDGWNGDHYKSIKSAADELGVELLLKENVKETAPECIPAVESLIEAGAKMVILGSFYYPGEMLDFMKTHQDVSFYGVSGQYDIPNFTAYSARAYQARYLAGVVAGLNTKTNKLGYVAAKNNSEVNRGINAFALGARRVNPKAKIYVAWTDSWDDGAVERENVNKLVKGAGVDVLGYQQNRTDVIEEAESLGVMTVAYSLRNFIYSPNVLTSVATSWQNVYKEIIQDFVQKKNSVSNYWVGADKDAIAVLYYSSAVSDSVKQIVDEIHQSLKEGMDVFSGPIFDNRHKRRCDKNEVVSDIVLRGEMTWFVEGVTVYEGQ